jgi:ATP-dependent DNA helicase RecQ
VLRPQQPIELPATAGKPRFADGDAVRAKRYGAGQVVGADLHSVTVQFPNGERRTFLPEFVRAARQVRAAAQAAQVG